MGFKTGIAQICFTYVWNGLNIYRKLNLTPLHLFSNGVDLCLFVASWFWHILNTRAVNERAQLLFEVLLQKIYYQVIWEQKKVLIALCQQSGQGCAEDPLSKWVRKEESASACYGEVSKLKLSLFRVSSQNTFQLGESQNGEMG